MRTNTDVTRIDFERYGNAIEMASPFREVGRVTHVQGQLIRGSLPGAAVGSMARISPGRGQPSTLAEVVGFVDSSVLLLPLTPVSGITHGAQLILEQTASTVPVGYQLLGRVIDPLGQPLDQLGPLDMYEDIQLYPQPLSPMKRPPITQSLPLGVRAIDAFLTVGRGQRVGIMAGSGVGKSVLLGMIAQSTRADINVIALIGERGREVREFIETNLGPQGLSRSVIVVATSDQSPLMRQRGAYVAAAVAEYFSKQGANVLLMMDSVTRFAMAQREVGLSIGEPPATKGYTPSVFSTLPRLLERAGNYEHGGSVTGLYTVLVEGDDLDDPIADSVRSIVDGHIVLSRKLAERGHFPAIDILQSTSRVMRQITTPEHQDLALRGRHALSAYAEAEDLINLGAYQKGSNPWIDFAIKTREPLRQFLQQSEPQDLTEAQLVQALNQRLSG